MKDYKRLTERRETPLTMSMWVGDSKSLQVYNRLAELEDKIESGDLIDRNEYESAIHRAEVAERALLIACVNLIKDEADNFNMELLARVVYTKFLRKAEKELAEEDEQ